jgi:ATP-dependent Clp protease protease subunit
MPFGQSLSVPYNLPGSRSWQWINIYTRLAQERILFLNQPLTMGLANSIISSLLYLDSQEEKPIYVYINSIGDPIDAGMADITAGMLSVTAGLAIYDTMMEMKSEIMTIGLGQVVGMAVLLLAAGVQGKRACLPHTSIVLTLPQSGTQGQASDIQVSAEQMLEKKHLLLEMLARQTGQSIERLATDLQRTYYMMPEQAKEYGLIDQVLPNTKGLPTVVSAGAA